MKDKFANIAVFDDDQGVLDLLSSILSKDYNVFPCSTKPTFLNVLQNESIDLVFLDIMLGNENGIEVLKDLKAKIPEIEVIMMSVIQDIDIVVDAIKLGAFDYLPKEFQPGEVLLKVNRALKEKEAKRNMKVLEVGKEISRTSPPLNIPDLEISTVLGKFKNAVRKSNFILIYGEKGVGKKTLVRESSLDSEYLYPFVILPQLKESQHLIESLFQSIQKTSPNDYSLIELAHNGVLYIENLGQTSLEFQEKLLSFLTRGFFIKSGRKVSPKVKIVCSFEEDPKDLTKQGKINKELFNLSKGMAAFVPPLRERKKDIGQLSNYYLRHYSRIYNKPSMKLAIEAKEFFSLYPWRHNINELKNVTESLVMTGSFNEIRLEELYIKHLFPIPKLSDPPNMKGISLKKKLMEFEKDNLIQTLRYFKGNKMKAANYLSVPYSTFKAKIKFHGIKKIVVGE